jgi:type IV pilus assembly protein PilC
MAEFLVKMADERGRVLQQVESAHTAAELRDRFSQQGFFVYDVRPRGLLLEAGGLRRRRKVKLEQFIIFNQQFVTLIRAGLPILTALELLAKRQRNEFFRGVLEEVRERVKSGESLSHAFEEQDVASKIYTTTLLAGEKAGNLEEVLGRYIAFQRIAISFRKKLIASLIYPALLFCAMLALFTVLIVFVVPKFGQLYGELHAELPPTTAFLLSVGESAQQYALIIAAVLVIGGFGLWRWKQSAAGAEHLDRFRMRLPLLGEIWLKYQIAIFSRTMSTLLSGGIPLVAALETAGNSIDSKIISRAVIEATRMVREGRPLSGSLEQTNIFPELAVEMMEVGESTGALPGMLTSIAEFYEEDVQTALTAALALIEPVILIIMGLVVGFVLLSLYVPIFTIGASAGAAR